MDSGLVDRAAKAFQESGEQAYWDTLSTQPARKELVQSDALAPDTVNHTVTTVRQASDQ